MTDDAQNNDGPRVKQKQRVAEKRAARGIGVGSREVLGTGAPNRHGMPKLPPGQHTVKDWPVLDMGILPEVTSQEWRLEVKGLVETPMVFDWDALMALPQVEDTSDFHCVTTWSRMDNKWVGVRLTDVLAACGVREEARHLFFIAYDDYTTNISMEEARKPDVLLVHTWEGAPLPKEHGGPVRVITPQLYAWKGAKWVKTIECLAEDRKGFWEVRGYSNTAAPWYDDRYSTDEE